ncbi:MAG TPA: hypothetical protein VHR84_00035 [Terriglobales bacterium]|jgi:hypothetical protein|nr:hypothetical protein [Terriglobales bacterium]
MAFPLRKDQPEEKLTTADIARGQRPTPEPANPKPVVDPAGPKPVTGERQAAQMSERREEAATLFPHEEMDHLRSRWSEIQTGFVDEPRKAVEQADVLVASAMKRLAEVFADERSRLEQHWDRGDNVSTEDLRVALQRYRTFFHRLLSV